MVRGSPILNVWKVLFLVKTKSCSMHSRSISAVTTVEDIRAEAGAGTDTGIAAKNDTRTSDIVIGSDVPVLRGERDQSGLDIDLLHLKGMGIESVGSDQEAILLPIVAAVIGVTRMNDTREGHDAES